MASSDNLPTHEEILSDFQEILEKYRSSNPEHRLKKYHLERQLATLEKNNGVPTDTSKYAEQGRFGGWKHLDDNHQKRAAKYLVWTKRRNAAGRKDMTAKEFKEWLFKYVLGHGKNRLRMDDPRRQQGFTIDPVKAMVALKKYGGLLKGEQRVWEDTMERIKDLVAEHEYPKIVAERKAAREAELKAKRKNGRRNSNVSRRSGARKSRAKRLPI